MTRFHKWVLWLAAGRPRHEPLVLEQGRVVVCRHGFALVTGWYWSFRYCRGYVRWGDELVDLYSSRYPQERVNYLYCCPMCTSTVTV